MTEVHLGTKLTQLLLEHRATIGGTHKVFIDILKHL